MQAFCGPSRGPAQHSVARETILLVRRPRHSGGEPTLRLWVPAFPDLSLLTSSACLLSIELMLLHTHLLVIVKVAVRLDVVRVHLVKLALHLVRLREDLVREADAAADLRPAGLIVIQAGDELLASPSPRRERGRSETAHH